MSKKKILFIVSSSKKSGFGHLKRCSVLSKKLSTYQNLLISDSRHFINKKINSLFHKIIIKKKITNKNIKNIIIKIKPNFIIFDTFTYKFDLLEFLRKKKIKSLQFVNNDYKFNIFADYLINSSPIPKKLSKFIFNKNIIQLKGERYSILDTDKILFKKKLLKFKKGKMIQVFLCLGGNYKISNLYKLVPFFNEFKNFKFNLFFKGNLEKNRSSIKRLSNNQKKIKILFNKDNILKYAFKSNFAIISGGTVLTEMIFLQIPSIVFSFSKNQETYASAWQKKKCCSYQGNFEGFLNKETKDQVLLVKNFLNKDIFLINKNMRYKLDDLGSSRISKIIEKHLK